MYLPFYYFCALYREAEYRCKRRSKGISVGEMF